MTRWLYVILLLGLSGDAHAQGTALSGLPSGAAVSGTDLFYDVQTVGVGGVKVTATALATFMNTAIIAGPTGSIQYNSGSGFGGFGNWNGTTLTVPSVTVSGFTTTGAVCNSSTGLLSTNTGLCSNVTSTGSGGIVLATSPTIAIATLTSPTITQGTITSPSISSGTITSPTINVVLGTSGRYLPLNAATSQGVVFQTNSTSIVTVDPSTRVFPGADNTGSLGTSTARFTSVYGVTYYTSASVVGVTCAAGTVSTATLAVTNGIVTHC